MKKHLIKDQSEINDKIFQERLQQSRKFAQLCKEGAETVIFICFSNKELMEFFNHSYLHYIFMPVLAFAFTADAGIEIVTFCKNKKNLVSYINLICSISAAALVDTVVAGSLITGGAFPIAPYLFLCALICMLIKLTTNLVNNLKLYQKATNPNEKIGYFQAATLNLVGILGISIISSLVTGIMIIPMGPWFALGLGVAATILTLGLIAWKLTPTHYKHKFKSCCSLFKKSTYLPTQIQKDSEMQLRST